MSAMVAKAAGMLPLFLTSTKILKMWYSEIPTIIETLALGSPEWHYRVHQNFDKFLQLQNLHVITILNS